MTPNQAFDAVKPLLSEVSSVLDSFDLPANGRAGFALLIATYFVTRAGLHLAEYEGESSRAALDARSREALRLIEAGFDAAPPRLRVITPTPEAPHEQR